MRKLVDWLLGRLRVRPVPTLAHPVLGMLRYDPEVRAWRSTADTSVGPLRFLFGGTDAPDAALLAHGETLVANAPKFLALVQEFLEEQSRGGSRGRSRGE